MKYSYASQEIKNYERSSIAKSETNDCFVRALASATNVDYDTAHSFVKEEMNRKNKKGTQNLEIVNAMKKFELNGLKVGSREYEVEVIKKPLLTNKYKLYGEYIHRQKTVKSFMKSLPKGTFIVCVSKHAFVVKDGVLIDNKGEEFRPTRKVLAAYAIDEKVVNKQLELF
jgi:hypothetical protein